MVEKAAGEGIVVNHTTFYDRFFTGKRWLSLLDRLPYFDGDCWPTLVEDLLINIKEETKKEERRGKKHPGVVNTDILLMYKVCQKSISSSLLLLLFFCCSGLIYLFFFSLASSFGRGKRSL